MTDFALDPAYVQIFYQTKYAPHKMTLPTRTWTPSAGVAGNFEAWDLTLVDADTIIKSLVNLLKVVYNPDCTFARYQIFTKASPTAQPLPVAGGSLGIAGTAAFTGYTDEATQVTVSMRSELFGPARIVTLDRPIFSGDFVKTLTLPTADQNVFAELASNGKPWAARDKHRINQSISWVATLNARLRREYHLK